MAMVWLRHVETGGVAQFPDEAVEAWSVKGWEPCDAPVDPDPALVEYVPNGLQRVALVPQIDNGVAFQLADLTTKPSKKTEK
jgi:hypothetical protein